MTQTIQAQQSAQAQTVAAQGEEKPAAPTIATRKSCNPDGIGLSHYVLMDKKAAK